MRTTTPDSKTTMDPTKYSLELMSLIITLKMYLLNHFSMI